MVSYFRAAAVGDLEPGQGKLVEVGGKKIALFNVDGTCDDHVSEHPFGYLRGWCPCAGRQGHESAPCYIHAPLSDLTQISAVGEYALSLTWSDGHDTGIYSSPYLRELRACSSCRPAATRER